jgi:hypothetical protein
MRTFVSVLVFLITVVLSAAASASSSRDVAKAVTDDTLLENAGIEPAAAQIRRPCSAAVVETDDPPEFFNCVYVQTAKDLNLFSLEDGYLMSELQLKLGNVEGVALQHMGKYSQVQIFDGHRVAVLYIHDASWIDPAETETVYHWLLEHGVRERAPVKWIGP